jgi:hypothetical protein
MRKSKARGAGCGVVFNLLAALLLIMSCLAGLAVTALFINPQLNPVGALRPPAAEGGDLPTRVPTRPAIVAVTPTSAGLVPTLPPAWTATNTATVTNTPRASNTPTATATRTAIPPTRTYTPTSSRTPTPTATGPTPTPSNTRSAFQFTLQTGSPAYTANIDNANGCSWFGISGQVFDLQNRGVIGLIVRWEGPNNTSGEAITGSAPKYGQSGYLIPLGNGPVASTNTYKVQLRNGSGQPLSEVVVLATFQDCNRNQILINFVQNR